MKNYIINRLKNQLLSITKGDGLIDTGVSGVQLARREIENKVSTCFNKPLIILVVQGSKNAVYGSENISYKEGELVITGVDLPSTSYVSKGTPKKPFLAISMPVDNEIVSSLIAELPANNISNYDSSKSVAIDIADDTIIETFSRLVDALSSNDNKSILAPMIIKEIHYRILLSPIGTQLRMINTIGSLSNKISKTISYVKENFNKPISVDELANIANMASSTFRRHFTYVTTLSPIQYQKKLRLYEAQRLLMTSDNNATTVAYAVGYESVTQFNREYKRLFGEAPKRNVKNILQLN